MGVIIHGVSVVYSFTTSKRLTRMFFGFLLRGAFVRAHPLPFRRHPAKGHSRLAVAGRGGGAGAGRGATAGEAVPCLSLASVAGDRG